MAEKIRFNSLAELQEKYPVGSVFRAYSHREHVFRTFYNQKDYNVLKRYYDVIEAVDDVTCECWKTVKHLMLVEGYLYDGKYWYPAYLTCDGWIAYNEYDLNRGK